MASHLARGFFLILSKSLVAFFCLFYGVMAQADGFDLRNELILDLWLNGESLQADVIAYQRDGGIFVSLAELMDGIEFPINVDVQSGQAGGWFISEEREFSLDLNTATVISDGDTLSLGSSAVVFEGELYVNTKALQDWFPLRLEPVLRELALNIEPEETLLLQKRMQRRAVRTRGRAAINRRPQLPLQETPYRWLGPHTTDLRLTTSSVRNGDDASSRESASYSLLSRGDFGKMTSSVSLTGREDEITSGRIRLERELKENPLNLNHVELGDASGGRGLMLRGGPTRGSLEKRFAGESVDLRGDILPGWEVELYRNDVLLDFQVVGDDGQYEFLRVPLELGENRFEFVFLGPYGEERREEETHFVGPGVLDRGAVSYELAAVQSERTVLGLNDGSGSEDRDSLRYLANVNLGLGRHLTARGGVDSFEQQGQRLENYEAGLNLAFSTFQASSAYSFQAQGQDVLNNSFRSRFGSNRLSLRYSHFFDDGLDAAQLGVNPARWRGNASLSIRPWLIPITFDASHTERTLSTSTQAAVATTLQAGGSNRLSKSFNYAKEDNRDRGLGQDEFLGGVLSFATSIRPWRLRAGLRYGIEPESEIRSLDASASVRVDEGMTMNFEIRRDRKSDRTNYLAGFNWQLAAFQLSPRISYDSEERMVGLVSLSTSLVPLSGRTMPVFKRLPHANSGQVRGRVFIDSDGDGKYGPSDEALEDVRIDAVQAFRFAETGRDGNAYLLNLQRGRQTDVALDARTLPGLDLEPAHLGRSVVPRAGSVAMMDFPVFRATELEGHVRTRTEFGLEPESRVLVLLVNAQGETISRQRTAFDGFFLFVGLPPGEYHLKLGESNAPQVIQSPGKLIVGGAGGIKRGLDFVLEKKSKRTFFDSVPDEQAARSFVPDSEARIAPKLEPASPLELNGASRSDRLASGNWTVQLGAFSQKDNARSYWEGLSASQPDLLAGFEARYGMNAGLTRLMVLPGIGLDTARTLCRKLKKSGVDCLARELD